MNFSDDIEPITTLKRDTAQLIERAAVRQSPIVITQNGKATAVLQDVESYERQQKTLVLLKLIAQGERDIDEGRTMDTEEVKKQITKRLRTHHQAK